MERGRAEGCVAGCAAVAGDGVCAAAGVGCDLVGCVVEEEAGVGLDGANSGLDCCASFSGIDAGDGAADFGGLVSCTLGRKGDCTGRVIEVSGVEALRGDGGGCVGKV